MTLKAIAKMLKEAPRMGRSIDDPEGSCYIVLSHTLANEIYCEIENSQDSFEICLDEKEKKIKRLQDKLSAFDGLYLPVLTLNHLAAELRKGIDTHDS